MNQDKVSYYNNQSKEQLVVFLANADYIEERLREKLFLLTGCRAFGDCDGMNGACVECNEVSPETVSRCIVFGNAFNRYRKNNKDRSRG